MTEKQEGRCATGNTVYFNEIRCDVIPSNLNMSVHNLLVSLIMLGESS